MTRGMIAIMLRVLLVLVAASAAVTAMAQQYRWVDEKGGVHYTDTPPPPTAKETQKKNLKGNAVGVQENYELSQATKSSPVTLYTHPACKDLCQMARDVLNKRGIPFTEVSATDEAKLNELRRVSGAIGVPVIIVGRQVQTSPSADAYNQALDLAGYPKAGLVRPRHQVAPEAPEAQGSGTGR
jgi:glutaredoxin